MSVKLAFLRAASAYVVSSLLTISVKGIPPKHEVRAFKIVLEGTIRNTAAATFNFDYRDYQSIMGSAGQVGGAFKKARVTYNDKTDAINLTPAEARVLAVYANGRDPFPEHFRNTSNIGGGAGTATVIPAVGSGALAFKIPMIIPFYDGNLDYPNAGCPSSAQLNRDGVEVNLETDGTAFNVSGGSASLQLALATAQIVPTAVKLYVTTSRVPAEFFAPTMYMRSRTITQQPDTEKGPFFDHFACLEQDPVNMEANTINSISVETDEIMSPRNITPTESAQLFGSTAQQDGVLFLDVTKNLLCGPFTPSSIGTGTTGLTCTPLVWQDGVSRDDESEWNVVANYRTIFLTLVGGSLSIPLLYWRSVPIDESKELIRTILAERGLGDVGFDSLAVKGGDAAKMYKPRWFASAA